MFSHVMVGSNDIERSKRFYDALLGVLGGRRADAKHQQDRTSAALLSTRWRNILR
jgi:catechol 2,3-dioxygenase-like lactoylglutathione lyase family enzyme